MTDFIPYPKTPRLFRDVVITEKVDGTNAAIQIYDAPLRPIVIVQSRKRVITPEDDNFGFARWVAENQAALATTLGDGVHFGEWWGSGIQRGYGLQKGEKRFSLFNVKRWEDADLSAVPGLGVVPVLYRGPFTTEVVARTVTRLAENGSCAAPGFMDPEGIIVFHVASGQVYKVTVKDDAAPKGLVA